MNTLKTVVRWIRPFLILGAVGWFALYAYERVETHANAEMRIALRDKDKSIVSFKKTIAEQQQKIDELQSHIDAFKVDVIHKLIQNPDESEDANGENTQ